MAMNWFINNNVFYDWEPMFVLNNLFWIVIKCKQNSWRLEFTKTKILRTLRNCIYERES